MPAQPRHHGACLPSGPYLLEGWNHLVHQALELPLLVEGGEANGYLLGAGVCEGPELFDDLPRAALGHP